MADEAPEATSGSGVVMAQRTRRTNLLSQMTNKERRAFLQTQLDADHMIKQMSAIRHGLPTACERVVLEEEEPAPEDTTTSDLIRLLQQKEQTSALDRNVAAQQQAEQVKAAADIAATDRTDLSIGKLLSIGAIAGVPGLAAVSALWSLWPSDEPAQPPQQDPPAIVAPVSSDDQTLSILHSEGLSAPRTPLGEKTLEAFQKDPALREKVMQQIEASLTDPADAD